METERMLRMARPCLDCDQHLVTPGHHSTTNICVSLLNCIVEIFHDVPLAILRCWWCCDIPCFGIFLVWGHSWIARIYAFASGLTASLQQDGQYKHPHILLILISNWLWKAGQVLNRPSIGGRRDRRPQLSSPKDQQPLLLTAGNFYQGVLGVNKVIHFGCNLCESLMLTVQEACFGIWHIMSEMIWSIMFFSDFGLLSVFLRFSSIFCSLLSSCCGSNVSSIGSSGYIVANSCQCYG